MSLRTLDEFIAADWNRLPRNAWVKYPGLAELYVRKGTILICEESRRLEPCLTIGAVSAKKPGKGAFTKLIEDLKSRGLSIYVENAHNPRLPRKLEDLGFRQINKEWGPNYLWEAK